MSDDTSYQPQKLYAAQSNEHISLGRPVRIILFILPLLLVGFLVSSSEAALFMMAVFAIVWWVIVSGVRVVAQWEQGVVLRLGNFRGLAEAGVVYIVPLIEYVRFIDLRTSVLNIPHQKAITRDNVPAEIDSVLFFKVENPETVVVTIQDYRFAIAQFTQGVLRDVVGSLTLDELLSEREQIQSKIRESVDEKAREWGIQIESVRLQDIELPEDLKRMMSRQASAEREKRATITKSEGDKLAAVNLAQAAEIMQKMPLAMQLRTLQTLDSLGVSPSNTVILFPAEFGDIFQKQRQEQAKTGNTATNHESVQFQ
jgi:regulator of protease activity HflC (stomatin/prohibitin superfamily)